MSWILVVLLWKCVRTIEPTVSDNVYAPAIFYWAFRFYLGCGSCTNTALRSVPIRARIKKTHLPIGPQTAQLTSQTRLG